MYENANLSACHVRFYYGHLILAIEYEVMTCGSHGRGQLVVPATKDSIDELGQAVANMRRDL